MYVVLKASPSGIALHPLAAGQTRKISLLSHFIDEELAEWLARPLGVGRGGERGSDGASDGFNAFHLLPSVLDTLHTACTRSSLGTSLPLPPLGTPMAARPSRWPGLPGAQQNLPAHGSPAGPGSDPHASAVPAPRGRQWLGNFMKGKGNGKSTTPRGRALPGSAAPPVSPHRATPHFGFAAGDLPGKSGDLFTHTPAFSTSSLANPVP